MSDPLPQPSWIQEVRARLANPSPKRLPPTEARQAAVLVPLFVDAGQLWTVLTKRSHELPSHKGQIAFPGGGAELGEDAWAAALRETEEEVGFEPARILKLGTLDELATFTGYRIVPCVGAVPTPVEPKANDAEIAEVFKVPLLAFANVRGIEERAFKINDVERTVRIYHVAGRQVWGLTARIIHNLMMRLGLPGEAMAAPETLEEL